MLKNYLQKKRKTEDSFVPATLAKSGFYFLNRWLAVLSSSCWLQGGSPVLSFSLFLIDLF